jgi:DnaD/phage-associated family protein
MIDIQLHSDCPSTDTIIPNQFIDDFMPEANGEFVKVYLYLLRCIHSHAYNCTISAIADKFNHTEMDVVRALRYWQKTNLIALEENADGDIVGIRLLPMPSCSAEVPAQSPEATVAVAPRSSKKTSARTTPVPAAKIPPRHQYTADEILSFQKDETMSELFFIVETYIRHPLGENDMNTVLFWHEQLHFSTELIVYLLEYCISKGHTSMRYLDKVALGWHEKNITSVEQAKEDAAIHTQAYYGVMKAFGITGRSLVETEKNFIRKWTKEYAFDLPLIQEACARTITATHQPSFEYADSILTSWHKNQVHTLADVEKIDAAYNKSRKTTAKAAAPASSRKKNSFNNFSSREYDYDNLEEMLLSSSVH